ncbi:MULTISPECIES: glycosyltransferase family 4 protein [unclassified Acinetobacter]|uniref:glycosyltransferase family 4 protein n=1 Tax=unclassified Acinetobacter TaxID=196816 RepID=UPI003C7E5E43
MPYQPAIWFPTIQANSGSDVFTKQLVTGLKNKGIRAEITWLPHHAEYLPWCVKVPKAPKWANIVHINTWLPLKFIPKHLPVISTLHHCVQDPLFRSYKSTLQHLYHSFWITPTERKILNLSSQITAVSHYTAQCANQIFEIQNFNVIHNGVDTNSLKPIQKDNPHKPFRLLFIGTPSKRKGFDILPEIMQQLGDDYELFYTARKNQISHNFPSNMHALGRVGNITDAYHNADALLFPSRLEGFGLVVAEAMACGLPVIASNSSALPEVVDNGITGLLCKKDDISSFTNAIRSIANDRELHQKMSHAGRLKAEQEFNLSKMVDQYLDIYLKILHSQADD